MKKVLTIILVLSLVFTAVFANGTKEAAAEASVGETTLKWALWDIASTTYYEPLIKAYEAKNPNVKIEMLDLGSADFMTMLQTQLSGGDSSIDVVTIKDIPGYNNLVKRNLLLNLNDKIKSEGVDLSLYGGTTDQISVDSKLYGIPFRSDFWIVYYNKDVFDKAGVAYPDNDMTFAEYDALARKMTSGTGANKVYGAHYHTWRSAVQLFGILDGKNTIVGGTYDFLKPYYQMVLNQQKDGVVQDYATLKTSSTHYSGVFYNNSVAMMNMGSWFIATLINQIEQGKTEVQNWGLAKYPHAEGVPAGTTLGTITSLGVSNASKKKDAAFDFVKFVTGPEGAEIIAKTGTIPAIKTAEVVKIIAAKPGFPTDQASRDALQVAKTYLEMPLHERAGEIEVVLNQVHDEIMTNNISVDAGIVKMNDQIQKILAK
ncbi:MAG: sugar ABC transporter substrate-binding protein [Sphaerochaeta sp.]|uniref:ABC transporter substrate-binding protein n=1 Tax=Sphaerochaeta sp. TaxID=1972642 RepID=UPI001D2D3D88|nr:sugar ABC transporter substrate-binding protein [uncultured Sphaerochaeta sp.]MDD3057659.1 sugar ABC transporter substrate-binding protein [Sphaerochaeta sp.]MDD3929191.1 sugar ABC transporter substrate-binding protein [Sphaerochaeta sp.]NCC90702.1 sugar ABC transporter substrate-binding protein [Spirochaetia bacterium]